MRTGKKPVHLAMTGGKSPRQITWEALRQLAKDGKSATTYAIARHSGQDDEAVRDYLRGLAKAGIIRQVSTTGRKDADWTLVQDEGIEAPRVNRAGKRQATEAVEFIWRALRIMGELSAEEAMAQAAAGGTPITEDAARRYLQRLANAGYLARSGGIPGHPARYRLIPARNSGPLYPVYQRHECHQIFDPNLGAVVWSQGEKPDAAVLNGYRIEAERLRVLLREWLADERSGGASRDLIARTESELEIEA
ncbi:hypothetical protein [Pseudomonas japonica]|uniref:hypothetical protein n=1 Tax=Pseudomonas japonica TaxID=256466 RepID=UPI003A8A1FA9